MCIVIDLNTIAAVFNPTDHGHSEFGPVWTWVNSGQGYVLYGGTGYMDELGRARNYLALMGELRKAQRAFYVNDGAVDTQQTHIVARLPNCPDAHVIALLGASRCPLLCSKDKGAIQHAKDKKLYPDGAPQVKVYSGARNQQLLVTYSNYPRKKLKNIT